MMGLLPKLGLVIAAFAMQAVCAQTPATTTGTEKKMENTESNKSPKLIVSISSDQSGLEVDYRVKNTTDRPIYLFNVILDMDAVDAVAKSPFYACLRDDRSLVLGKRIMPVPSMASIEFRDIPYATKIAAGQEFGEKLKLQLPIDEYNPYFPVGPETKTELTPAERVVVEVEFIREIEGLTAKETKIANAISIWHKDLFGNIERLTSNPSPVSVQVNKRIDKFERF